MPLYEYRCQACDRVLEFLQKVGEAPKRKCSECGGRLEKLVSRSGFVLKGSGWYVTEYGKSGAKAPSGEGKSESAPTDSTSAGADDSSSSTAPGGGKKDAAGGKKAASGS